jgi:hypothetical protein
MDDSSMKYKWDNQNVLDYAVSTAVASAVKQAEYKNTVTIAR